MTVRRNRSYTPSQRKGFFRFRGKHGKLTEPPQKSWQVLISHHLQAFVASFKPIIHTPLASLMTLAVIGAALALPACLYVLLANVENLSHSWDDGTQISLFLKMDVSQQQAEDLVVRLKLMPEIERVNYISPSRGLAKFQQQSGIKDILIELEANPLPSLLEVFPQKNMHAPAAVKQLLAKLNQIPEVEVAQLDLVWLKRLYAFIKISKRTVFALAFLLGLAVLLVIANTIRLTTQNRKEEIQVISMIGATRSFIRRPFLYNGVLYGLIGAMLAWILTTMTIFWLSEPVAELADLYKSFFQLKGLDLADGFKLLFIGAALGFIGAWLAVSRQLQLIQDLERHSP